MKKAKSEKRAKILIAAISALMLVSLISVFQAGAASAQGKQWKGISDGVCVGFENDDKFLYLSFDVEEVEETFLFVFMDTKEGGRDDGADYMIVDPFFGAYPDWYLGKWRTAAERESLGASSGIAPGWSETYDYAHSMGRDWNAWECEDFKAEESRTEGCTHYDFRIPLADIEFKAAYGLNLLVQTGAGVGDWLELAPGPVVNEKTEVTYDTIQLAIDAASPGDTVLVYPGAYVEESFPITIDKDNITIVSEAGPEETIIDAEGADSAIKMFDVDNVTLEGFTVTGAKYPLNLNNTEGIVLANNIINLAGRKSWIQITSSNDLTFRDSTIENSESDARSAVAFKSSSNCRFVNNLVQNNELQGLSLTWCENFDISNNTFRNNGQLGMKLNVTNCTIEYNVIENNANAGIWINVGDNIEAHYNNIENNPFGINNTSPSTIDATLNWWGTKDGSAIAKMVSGNVNYTPWLDALGGGPTRGEQITLTPESGFASTTVAGENFTPNSTVTIDWAGTELPTVPTEVKTLADGCFTAIISVLNQDAPGEYTVTATDASDISASAMFTVENMMGPEGPEGPEGDKGDPGADGAKGDKGDTGDQGLPGDKGDPGADGAKGDKGDTGATGATGATGPEGPEGPKGDKGDTGDVGAKGDTGATGATGPAAPAGTVPLGISVFALVAVILVFAYVILRRR